MREVKRDFPWFSITEYEKDCEPLQLFLGNPVCGGAMKQQFIGLRHCKCGISWKISGQRVIYPVE